MKGLNNLLELLVKSDIDFVLIGGYAGVVYGSSIVTKDIEICAVLGPDNIKKIRESLKDYKPKHRMTANKLSLMDHPSDLNTVKNLYIETELGVLDIISDVSGVGDFEKLKENAIEITIYGHKCKVISIEDLIKTKKALGRPKDLLAVEELQKLKK
jgi:predicted nucleotidyltransferase